MNVSGVDVAVAVGVPEITPVVVFKESPDGKSPDVFAQELYVPVPPVAASDVE